LTNEIISLAPSGKNGSVGYALDPVGNRTSDTSSLSGISSGNFSFNADDELASESYDQNGNVLATGGKTFAYNSQNELVSMGSTATLLYDADGNRVSKSVSGVVTKYLVDDLNPTGYPQVVDELTNGSVTRTYAYGLQRIDENQVISSTWTPSFYGYDGGGNVRQLTSTAGTVTDTYEYDSFGNKFTVSGTTPNNYLYRGEQYDPDLGLYYLRARYYNPLTGRFMSRDPLRGLNLDPKTLHKYLYVASNPVNNVDPSGRELFDYAIESNAAIPEARLIDIYGCVADASLTAVSLIINPTISDSTALGGAGAVIGCVALTPGIDELTKTGSAITKGAIGAIKLLGVSADWGACALDVKEFVIGLDGLLSGTGSGVEITNSLTALGGCVNSAVGYLLKHPGATLQGLGLD
jgi:RHS repeat-associated protein